MNKEEVYEALVVQLEKQLVELQNAINKVQESIVGEEKSTAGDKYETARAMAHTELTQLSRQLAGAKQSASVLNQIKPKTVHDTCRLGSLVRTESRMLYLSVGFGKFKTKEDTCFAISAGSPIGQALLGKGKGDLLKIGDREEHIIDIK